MNGKPAATPKFSAKVVRTPLWAPDAASRTLFGPGSIDDATTKARNATLPDCTVGRRPDQPPDRSD